MTAALVAAFCGLIAAVALSARGDGEAETGSGASAGRGLSTLVLIRERWASRLDAEHIRRDAAQLLRQLSALLQSGRGVGQAWGDLHEHWSRRRPDHPIVRLCAHAVAGDRIGRGSEEGLRSFSRSRADRPPRGIADLLFGLRPAPGEAPLTGAEVGDDAPERLMTPAAARELDRTVHRLTGVAALSARTGAPLSGLVEQIAGAADDAAELHAQVRTAAAGPRLTQTILALLPVGGAVIGQLIGADAAAVLLHTTFGRVCLFLGGVLMACGWWWSSRMIAQVADHV